MTDPLGPLWFHLQAPQASTAAAVQPAWLGGAWAKAWYAVCAVKDFDASRPQPFTLLGKELVIWRAPDGAWGCLEDRCPHRAVPLSGVRCRRPACAGALPRWPPPPRPPPHTAARSCSAHALVAEGKVWADGSLMCSYHGWRFADDGACKASEY